VTLSGTLAPEVAEAVSLDVRRMTARRRDHRQVITARLEGMLQVIRDAAVRDSGVLVTDRALRSAITRAAAAKLRDLFYLAADRKNHLVASSYRTRHPAVMAGLRHVVETARRAATPVHVFALLADMDYYVRQLAANGFMMCTAELQQLARSSRRL
jgi:hypothetical protein